MAKSFLWSFCTLVIIFFFLNSQKLFGYHGNLTSGIMLVAVIALLFVGRYYPKYVYEILLALAFACIFIGIIGLIYKEGIPVVLTNEFAIMRCFVLATVLLVISRVLLVHVVFNNWLRRYFRRQVAIIGSDSEAATIARNIIDNNAPFWVAGILAAQSDCELEQLAGKKCLGTIEKLFNIVEQFQIDDIVITEEVMDKSSLVSILEFCISNGINAWFSPKLLPIINVKLRLDNFCGQPMILLCSQKNTWVYDNVKHVFDKLAAFLLCFLFFPLFLLIALAVKLDSPGSVFYRPQAIGKGGAVFSLYKFRSMKENSENKIHKDFVSQLIKGELNKDKNAETPLKITNDPRVTAVGKILRKFSLDELPQLFNVIKNDMSLVGPRPCLPYEYEMYKDWHKKRTTVRAGITGLWQVMGRSEVLFDDMILLDLYYIYNRNLLLDIFILIETVFVVIGKKGAY